MTDQKDLIAAMSGRRLTAVRIGEVLGVTEKTARKRLADGLSADDVITICRAEGVNPTEALVELKMLTLAEVMDYIDTDGTLVATADEKELVSELADRMLTTNELAEMVSRRTRIPSNVVSPQFGRPDMSDLPDNVAAHHGEVGIPDEISEAEEPQTHPEDD